MDDIKSALRDSSPQLKLVLFDIDGTILSSGSFTKCLVKVVVDKLGSSVNTAPLSDRAKTGSTMKSVLISILNEEGIPEDKQEGLVEEMLSSATMEYKSWLSKFPLKLLDGVAELIELLSSREDVMLGIVTNNIKEMMLLKLDNVKLLEVFSRYGLMFPGDNIPGDKASLLELVVESAVKNFSPRLDRKNIFYIGDQVSDMLGAKAAGAVAVGIATGKSTFEELEAAGASAVFRSFADNARAAMAVIEMPRAYAAKKMTV